MHDSGAKLSWAVLLGAGPGERSSSGLLEWESINDAMEALSMINHYQMKNASKCLSTKHIYIK